MDSEQLRLFSRRNPLPQRLGSKFVRAVPALPGVYWMLDGKGRVLFVSQTENLKKKLTELQQLDIDTLSHRLEAVILGAEMVGFQVTGSVHSAAVVEAELLARLKPMGNVTLAPPAKRLGWMIRMMPRSWRLEVVSAEREAATDQTGMKKVDGLIAIGPFVGPQKVMRVQAALLRQIFGFTRARFSLTEIPPFLLRPATGQAGVFVDAELSTELAGEGLSEKHDFNFALLETTQRFLCGDDEWPLFEPMFGDRWSEELWRSDQLSLSVAIKSFLRPSAKTAQNAVV